MKITEPDDIKNNENEFIDGLIGELDWQVIETLLKEKYKLRLHDDVEYKRGDIVVHGNAIAYKLDFDVRVTLSLVVGRDGECVGIRASGNNSSGEDDETDEFPSQGPDSDLNAVDDEETARSFKPPDPRHAIHQKKNEEMASHLADIMNEINR